MSTIVIPTLTDLPAAAKKLLSAIGSYRKIAFSGDMGAGKTTIIQSLCHALGVQEVVSSPTFALINEYNTAAGETVYHFDLYRIDNVTEMYDMGYEDYFYSDAYCFIEWPEKAIGLIPDDALFVRIAVQDDGSRVLTLGPRQAVV